jgi:hypothetical protein
VTRHSRPLTSFMHRCFDGNDTDSWDDCGSTITVLSRELVGDEKQHEPDLYLKVYSRGHLHGVASRTTSHVQWFCVAWPKVLAVESPHEVSVCARFFECGEQH